MNEDGFLQSLTDTRLYSIGAYFCDRHPDLVDDLIAQSDAIEQAGLDRYARAEGIELEACFQTLVTGLAVRYFKAVAGEAAPRPGSRGGLRAPWGRRATGD